MNKLVTHKTGRREIRASSSRFLPLKNQDEEMSKK